MEHQLTQLRDQALQAITTAASLPDLNLVKVNYLGKKGALTDLLKGVGQLSAEQKPIIGKLVNTVKQDISHAIESRQKILEQDAIDAMLQQETIDVTLPAAKVQRGSLHPVIKVMTRAVGILSQYGFNAVMGPEVETEYYNFCALNIPEHHPARAMQDTFYFENGQLLRTHTSPMQIRQMQQHGVPLRCLALGPVYRRDSDQTHTPQFHQLEGLLVDKAVSFVDLKKRLTEFLQEFFGPSCRLRFRPSYFPFTEPSAEVDIFNEKTGAWLEVLGCGMVHPNVLRQGGINPDEYSGYAFGIGLDRLAMLYYDITDLRLLFESDIRFLEQFSSY